VTENKKLTLSTFILVILVLIGASLVAFFVTANTGLFNSQSSSFATSNIALESIKGDSIVANNNRNRPPPAALTSLCSNLALDSKQSKLPSFAGRPATLVYACNKNGYQAFFTSFSRRAGTQAVTPLFALPPGWTLSVGVARPSGECSSKDGLVKLTTGTPVTLPAGTNYIYCLTTSSASNFASFTISWTQ